MTRAKPTGHSWGRYPPARHDAILQPADADALAAAYARGGLPVGLQRSYGDVCLNDGGVLIALPRCDRLLAFDADTGVLRCEAGVSLDALIRLLLPRGWFPAVVPGTRHVTVGGAIACDVHGKNHHRAGSFGRHLQSLELLRPDGEILKCSPRQNAELFAATIGGLGQTGCILRAEIVLRRVPGPWLQVEARPFADPEEFFALSRAAAAEYEYSVAWFDCLNCQGRGVLFLGNHSAATGGRTPREWPLALPFTPPFPLVTSTGVRLFNRAYFHRQRRRPGPALVHWRPFFFPLDGIAHWNRLYGRPGFRQFQCVLPTTEASAGLKALLAAIRAADSGSFLAVLKEFGDLLSPGLLSFPQAGSTLALDLPNRPGVEALMQRLHAITHDHGGRIYAAKDADLSAAHFRQGYPDWERWAAQIPGPPRSDFTRRILDSNS